MSSIEPTQPIPVRSIFISDQHLGFRFSRAEACHEFLKQYWPERLYLVGDFLDGWRLARKWYWPESYDRLVDHLLFLISQGVQVYYTPGNHDDFLRSPHPSFEGVTICDEFIHTMLDGRRFLVTHGDLFDSIEKKHHRLSRFGSSVYDALARLNYFTNWLIGLARIPKVNYCFWAKRWSKKIVGAVGGFQNVLMQNAVDRECTGVICGHIHRPEIVSRANEMIYCNVGDWVEHQSALIEHLDGTLTLSDRGKILGKVVPNACPTPKVKLPATAPEVAATTTVA